MQTKSPSRFLTKIALLSLLFFCSFKSHAQIYDSVQIANTTSEAAHKLITTGTSTTGVTETRSYRDVTNGYFSYRLNVDSIEQQQLRLVFYGSDAGKRAFDVYVEGLKVAYIKLKGDSTGKFMRYYLQIPYAATRHKDSVTVKLLARGTDSIAGGLYNIHISKSTAPSTNWPGGVHDPSSIIKCGDKYWVFSTGDGIYAQYSTDLVTWTAGPSPFSRYTFPSWISTYAKSGTTTFENYFWAPDVVYMNGKYYLYYSCSIWGTMYSCIGCVVNKTLEPTDPAYKWEDLGDIGIHSSWSTTYVNAIDPSVLKANGKAFLTYGSFNREGIMTVELDTLTGKPKATSYVSTVSPGTSIANCWTGGTAYGAGEGSCMIYKSGYYYLFYNKGGCCSGTASSYYIVMGRSTSPTGPFVDKTGASMRVVGATSGGTVFFRHDDTRGSRDRFYGPGHLGYMKDNGTEYVSFHYYDGANNGYPTLGLGKLNWGTDGWPTISFDFLDKGTYTIKNVNSNLYIDLNDNPPVSGTVIMQNTYNSLSESQRWNLTPLGTGEYKITSFQDSTKALEVSGTSHDYILSMATYTDSVYQKFRIDKSLNGDVLIYPSKVNKLFEVPSASTAAKAQLKLWWFTNHPCQRWVVALANEALSVSRDTFTFSPIAVSNASFTITSNVAWSITDNSASWLSFSATSGTGNGTVSMNLESNPYLVARSCTFKIKTTRGKIISVKVVQRGMGSESLELSSNLIELPFDQSEASLVSVMGNTSWTVSSPTSTWLHVAVEKDGNNGTLSLTVDRNNSLNDRTDTVRLTTFNGKIYKLAVRQLQLTFELSANYFDMESASGTVSLGITSNVPWTVTSSDTWLSTSVAEGSADATLDVVASRNFSTLSRSATITVSINSSISKYATITQAGITEQFAIAEDTVSVSYNDSIGVSIGVLSNTSWSVSGTIETWLHVSPVSGIDSSELIILADNNMNLTSRSAIIELVSYNGQTWQVVVNQGAYPEAVVYTLAVSSTSEYVDWTATSLSIKVRSNDQWQASGNVSWLSLSKEQSTGNDTLTIKIAKNTLNTSRTGKVTVVTSSGVVRIITITQRKYSLTSVSESIAAEVSVYPNPASEQMNVQCLVPAKLSIYSGFGQSLVEVQITESPATIDLRNFKTGVYIYRIETATGTSTGKLIKQ